MKKGKYFSLVCDILKQQKEEFKITPQKLEKILGQQLSYEKGMEHLHTRYATLTDQELLNQLSAEDIVYLSLVSEIPKESDPIQEEYTLTQRGIRFGSKQPHQYSEYSGELANAVKLERLIIRTEEDAISDSGRSIYNYFKNCLFRERTLAVRKIAKHEVIEAYTEDRITGWVETLAEFLNEPSKMSDTMYKAVFFTDSGVFLVNESTKDYNFISYTPETQKKIEGHLKQTKRYQHAELKKDIVDKLGSFRREFSLIVESQVKNKVAELPREKLSHLEQKSLEFREAYGVNIPCRKIDPSNLTFLPKVSEADLKTMVSFYEVLQNLSGGYIKEIVKYPAPGDWDGTIQGAMALSGQRWARLMSETMRNPTDLAFTATGLDTIGLDECDIIALQNDFDKYLQMHVSRLSEALFFTVPAASKDKYLQLIGGEVSKQAGAFRAYGIKHKDAATSVRLMSFIRDATEYQMSEIENRECKLESQKKEYFKELFQN